MTPANPYTFAPKGGPRLHVDDVGGKGLPVLFQHGLCGDANQTAEILPASSAFRRITLEARGHGRSEAGELSAFSIATFTDDCIALVSESGLGPVAAAGISMGAAIALRLAVFEPSMVKALVLARPAWAFHAGPANMAPNAEAGLLIGQFSAEEAKARFLAGSTARRLERDAPDNLASLCGFFAREAREVTANLLTRIASDGPGVTRAQARSIAVPTLVIGNAGDVIHPLEIAEDLAAEIPHARLAIITAKATDRGKHVTEFRSVLQTFLKGLAP